MRNDEGGMFCCPAPPILVPQPTGGVAAAASVLDVADTPGCNLPDTIARGLAPVAGNDVCGRDVWLWLKVRTQRQRAATLAQESGR